MCRAQKVSRGRGGSAARDSPAVGEFRPVGGEPVGSGFQSRGLKKEGGNLLRGVPPTKKLQHLFSVGALIGSFSCLKMKNALLVPATLILQALQPPASSAVAFDVTLCIISPPRVESRVFLKKFPAVVCVALCGHQGLYVRIISGNPPAVASPVRPSRECRDIPEEKRSPCGGGNRPSRPRRGCVEGRDARRR